ARGQGGGRSRHALDDAAQPPAYPDWVERPQAKDVPGQINRGTLHIVAKLIQPEEYGRRTELLLETLGHGVERRRGTPISIGRQHVQQLLRAEQRGGP